MEGPNLAVVIVRGDEQRGACPGKLPQWVARPWSGAAHRVSPVVASSLVLVGAVVRIEGRRALCGRKLVSVGGLMEFRRVPRALSRCAVCERMHERRERR